ncbi:MAG: hypothetical protein ACI9L6_000764 [Flavobacterium sp.]|jgi:hypothetical protein
MKLHSDLPFYKSTYDLLLGIFEFTKSFSKEYKYTVGESLKKETIASPSISFHKASASVALVLTIKINSNLFLKQFGR